MAGKVTHGSAELRRAGLLSADAELEPIAHGFTYTEGPVWDPARELLLFHDIPPDKRYRWTDADGASVDAHPTSFSNGMTLDWEGRLLICESGRNRVVRVEADGSSTVLASHFDGKELNSPNDIVVRSNGDVYFTDPAYGRIPVYGVDRPAQLDHQGVYRILDGGGEPELLSDELIQPNGLAFSPDEKTLYVADTETADVHAFDVDAHGRLAGRRVFFGDAGVPLSFEDAYHNRLPPGYLDGMKCDERGNLYQTGRGGVWVIDPSGEACGVLELPEEVSNLAWGSADFRTLYFTCRTTIYRIQMEVNGQPRVW